MAKNKIKHMFKNIEPTEEQLEQMWTCICQHASSMKMEEEESDSLSAQAQHTFCQSKKRMNFKWRFRRITVAVLFAAILLTVCGIGINVATDGALMTSIEKMIGMQHAKQAEQKKQTEQEIIKDTIKIYNNGLDFFAPDIIYIDEEMVIFGHLRGIIIYDLQQEQPIGAIDTQSIGCMYLDESVDSTKRTCVLKEEDSIFVFNIENGSPYGNLYRYELPRSQDLTDTELTVSDVLTDEEVLQEVYGKWEDRQHFLVDSFEQFSENPKARFMFDVVMGERHEYAEYSQNSYCWTDSDGWDKISFLLIWMEDSEAMSYHVYTYDTHYGVFTSQELRVDIARETSGEKKSASDEEKLPDFVYTGDNPVIATLWEYFAPNSSLWEDGSQPCPAFVYLEDERIEELTEETHFTMWKDIYWGEVYQSEKDVCVVPSFVILRELDRNGEHLVFGIFRVRSYIRVGNVLEERRSNSYITDGCFHLREGSNGYEIVRIDTIDPAPGYDQGLKTMTQDVPGLWEEFMDYKKTSLLEQEKRKEFLRMYIENNHLDIQYYKNYGWEPVDIFGD